MAVLSPHFQYAPRAFNAAELDAIREEILRTLSNLDFQSAPRTGDHCRYCPASLICLALHREANHFAVALQELPTGTEAARLLETVIRVEAVCDEIKSHYKAQLEADPTYVPGWKLVSSVRRWISNPFQALEHPIEQFSVSEFLETCSCSFRIQSAPDQEYPPRLNPAANLTDSWTAFWPRNVPRLA